MQHVLNLLRDHTDGGLWPPPAFREALFEASLSTEPGARDAVQPHHNFHLPEPLRQLCAEALPVSAGAAALLRRTEDAFNALAVIFADRQFRGELRRIGERAGMHEHVTWLIRLAAELIELAAPRADTGLASGGVLASVGANPVVVEPLARPAGPPPSSGPRRPAWLPTALVEAWDTPLRGRYQKEVLPTLGHVVECLASSEAPPPALAVSLRALLNSPDRVLLLLLARAEARGDLRPHRDALAPLLAEASRMYSAFSANSSALALAERLSGLLQSAPNRGSASAQERAHALAMHARTSLRAGQAATARALFAQLALQHPTDPAVLLEAFLAVQTEAPDEAHALAGAALLAGVELRPENWLALAEFFDIRGASAEARACLARGSSGGAGVSEHLACAANMALRAGNGALWQVLFAEYADTLGMPLAAYDPAASNAVFAFAGAGDLKSPHEELVSVVMTAWNAEGTLEAAALSVLASRGCQVELIIVDDGSTDGTASVMARLAAAEPRVRLLASPHNQGTYAAKNQGIGVATGEFIALHDSDDWAHPLKLHAQLSELKRGFACSTSQWLRMRADGLLVQRRGGGYVHLNPASTLFRKELLAEIGPFDRVRAGADAEFLARIRLRYGWGTVSTLQRCLALGLHHEASLTQSGSTAFDEHRHSPARLAYAESWLDWHLRQLELGKPVALHGRGRRPFRVPREIAVQRRVSIGVQL